MAQEVFILTLSSGSGSPLMNFAESSLSLFLVVVQAQLLSRRQHGLLILSWEQVHGMTRSVLMVFALSLTIASGNATRIIAGLLDELAIWGRALFAAGISVKLCCLHSSFAQSLTFHRGARHGGLVHVCM